MTETGARGHGIDEAWTESKQEPRFGWAVATKTDREIRNGICEYAKCTQCECYTACEWGKEAVRRGIVRPESAVTSWHNWIEDAPVVEHLKSSWATLNEIVAETGLSDWVVRKRILDARIRPVARIRHRSALCCVFRRRETMRAVMNG